MKKLSGKMKVNSASKKMTKKSSFKSKMFSSKDESDEYDSALDADSELDDINGMDSALDDISDDKNVDISDDVSDDSDEDASDDGDDVSDEDNENASDDENELEFEDEIDSDVENEEETDNETDAGDGNEFIRHKKSLYKLKQTDPEFYKYLQENDKKLLKFDSEDDSEGDEEKVHQPPDALVGDSDESDFEEDEVKKKRSGKIITLAMVKKWKSDLIKEPSLDNIITVVKAFNAALARVKGDESSEYKVEGSSVFNSIVELCVMNLETAFTKFLKLPKNNKQPTKSKKWVKVRATVQTYLSDLFKLLSGVTSNHIISVLLKHLHGICYLVVCFHKMSRNCLKLMVNFWSRGEESVRVLAYLCILRLTTCFSDCKTHLLDYALKLLYISYVKNTKFVSVNTMPQINFMRRSLADILTINPKLSYQHAFLYIRQLAIHLRNAVTVRKKEHFQTIYNWQYINSLHIWVELICNQTSPLDQLSYPLITIIFGCIKLIPTSQYVPLRFHCLNMLVKLGRQTDLYIPILPYTLETFSVVNLNMKHKKSSMKPFDISCILRFSKGAMTESAFTDAVVDNIYQILVDTCYNHSNSISFPDLVVPVMVQLRSFVKSTKVAKYSSKFKQLLSKIEENSKFITNERNKMIINLADKDKIKAFEANIRLKGTPMSKFWDQWNQANIMKRPRKIEESETKDDDTKVEEEPVFTIRKDLKRKPDTGPTTLFPSDDESDQEITTLLCGPLEPDEEPSKKAKLSDDASEESTDEDFKEEEKEETEDEGDDGVEDADDVVEEFNLSKF